MRFKPHIATLATLLLGLGATAAAADGPNTARSLIPASRPASASPCSEVCSGGAASYGTPSSTASAGPCSEVCSGGAASYGVPSPNVGTTGSNRPTIVRIVAHDGGFDWGDAGIGVAGGVALSMLGLGGALATSQRRTRRSARSATLTS